MGERAVTSCAPWARHRLIWVGLAATVLVTLAVSLQSSSVEPPPQSASSRAQGRSASVSRRVSFDAKFARIPIGFESNQGQAESAVRFVAHGAGYTALFEPDAAVIVLGKPSRPAQAALPGLPPAPAIPKVTRSVVRISLERGARASSIVGSDKLPGVTNYFLGNQRARWHKDIPTYARVEYRRAWPGIDVVYHGTNRQLESDFMVAPGADPSRIDLGVGGAAGLKIDNSGNLLIATKAGTLELLKPRAYQEISGRRREVAAQYALAPGHQVRFKVARYDRRRALIIDPALSYSTYLGGVAALGESIAVDSSGDAYVAGWVGTQDFPVTSGAYNTTGAPGDHVFVAKLTADGSALVWATYLGGSGVDLGFGVAVDASNNVYVAGYTSSTDFPQANTTVPEANLGNGDGFVTELNSSGNGLVYSTYLGGSNLDLATAIAVDGASPANAYVVGHTQSTNFPVTSATAFQPTNPISTCCIYNGFFTELSVSGGNVGEAYSTYIGGPLVADEPSGVTLNGVAVDGAGNAYISGSAAASFPATVGSFKGNIDALVVRIDPTKSGSASLIYATEFGGSGFEYADKIALPPVAVRTATPMSPAPPTRTTFPRRSGKPRWPAWPTPSSPISTPAGR